MIRWLNLIPLLMLASCTIVMCGEDNTRAQSYEKCNGVHEEIK